VRLKHHVLIGTALSTLLLPSIGPSASAGFLTASVLIDLDHYLDFIVHNRFRSFSIKKMFLYHSYLFPRIKRPEFLSLEVFHTIEFLGGMAVLSLGLKSLLLEAVTAGMTLHCLCDMIYLKRLGAFSARAHSFVEYFIRRRRMVRQGIAIEKPFQEVLQLMESSQITLTRITPFAIKSPG